MRMAVPSSQSWMPSPGSRLAWRARRCIRRCIAASLSVASVSSNVNSGVGVGFRSEEHTSELQSLMRISYAVFCLKKKNSTNVTTDELITHMQRVYKKTRIQIGASHTVEQNSIK